ncbi:signal peptide peptidase SppA [Stieleria varia]|uniref:Putative signal peptide peptidase SppA n=1 Tax=Stieleria varia TaxID=2528005 RepID=A0A5C6A3G7_9BACT|nr:signal peptide peptidase SppA [Stieleria varia]TWT93741.1 putative signal peptide peptidase SppA [Stieleria varia]
MSRPADSRPKQQPVTSLLFVTAVLLFTFVGCGRRTLMHRGEMTVGGKMGVSGDVGFSGDVNMNGDINTTMSMITNNTASRLAPVLVSGSTQSGTQAKVAVIDVDGLLLDKNISGFGSMGENPVALFREKLDAVREDANVTALVLRINSPGGGVTASDMMCHELEKLKTERKMPVVACLMDTGTGGAYYLASHCDQVISHPTTIVGGIGVILNVYNLEDTMGSFNILSTPVKSGEQIDAGTPERTMADEELEMLQAIADSFHLRFTDHIARVRSKATDAKSWSEGQVFSGQRAVELGLVDRVGYLDDAIELAQQMSGATSDSGVVMYRRDNDRAYTPLDVTPNQPTMSSLLPIKMPGLDRSSMPTFLYLWQPEPSMSSGI